MKKWILALFITTMCLSLLSCGNWRGHYRQQKRVNMIGNLPDKGEYAYLVAVRKR